MHSDEIKSLVQKTIKYGTFTLHSRQSSSWICDLTLIQDSFFNILKMMPIKGIAVGLEFNGAILSSQYEDGHHGILRKDSNLYVDIYAQRYIKDVTIIDDVVTTESSLINATRICEGQGLNVVGYSVVLDRRSEENKTLLIASLVTCHDLGLNP